MEDFNVVIREFEPWSINNTKHALFMNPKFNKGYIVLTSKEPIDELSVYGLFHLIESRLYTYQGLDITMYLHSAHFSHNQKLYIHGDNTIHKYENGRCIDYIDLNEAQIKECESAVNILVLEYETFERYNQSKLWRLFNKRYQDVVCNYSFY